MKSSLTPPDEATRKAAVLVSALDPHSARLLLEKMDPEQARRVQMAIVELNQIPSDEEQTIVEDFLRSGEPQDSPDEGVELDESLAEKLAERTTVPEPATVPEDDRRPFRFLEEATPAALASHLGSENPQIIAVVVAHLPPQRAAEFISYLDSRLQADILRRVAELDIADASIVVEVEQQIQALLADEIRSARNRASGIAAVSSILTAAGKDRESLWENVARHDRSLVQMLQARSGARSAKPVEADPAPRPTGSIATSGPVPSDKEAVGPKNGLPESMPRTAAPPPEEVVDFMSLSELSDRDLVTLLTKLPSELVLLALTGAPPAFVKRLLKPLPAREARALSRRIAAVGPLRLADIEEAQARVASVATQLARDGLIQSLPAARFAAAA